MLKKITELRNNSGFMKYFKNTSWMMFEKILRIIAALVIGTWVTRYLGPKDFGILSYAQSFVGLFAAFSTLGLDGLIAKDLVQKSEEKYVILGTTFIMQTIGSIILMGFLVGSIYFRNEDELTSKIILIMGLLTFLSSFNGIRVYFQSIVETKRLIIPGIVVLVLFSIIRVMLILNKAPLIYFVYAIFFDALALVLAIIYVYAKSKQSMFKWTFSLQKAKNLLHHSWPLILNTIFISVYVRVDQVMIESFMDADSVGQYGAAVNLSQAWYFIPGIIGSSLFPAILNAKSISEKLYYERLQKLYDLMVILAVSIAIPMTFISDWVVALVYNDAYYLTGDVLSIHIWAGVFVFLGVSVSRWVLTENLQRISSVTLFMGMVSNIVLNYVLIPIYGIFGAAIATLISQSISVLFAPLLFKKTRPSFFMMLKALNIFRAIRSIF